MHRVRPPGACQRGHRHAREVLALLKESRAPGAGTGAAAAPPRRATRGVWWITGLFAAADSHIQCGRVAAGDVNTLTPLRATARGRARRAGEGVSQSCTDAPRPTTGVHERMTSLVTRVPPCSSSGSPPPSPRCMDKDTHRKGQAFQAGHRRRWLPRCSIPSSRSGTGRALRQEGAGNVNAAAARGSRCQVPRTPHASRIERLCRLDPPR